MTRCLLTQTAPVSPRLRQRGEVIVIASGKGGVGKTNLALNLGIHLSRRGQRVILLDADFGLANADILLDVSPLADFSDLLDSSRPVDGLLVDGPDGLRVLCGVSGLTRSGRPLRLDRATCQRALRRLQPECDVLIVDCGAGVTPAIVSFALVANLLIMATTPEPTALADAYATLKLLCTHGFDRRTGVVVNMVHTRSEATSTARRLSTVATRFLGLSVEDLGHVITDRHVPEAVRKRTPVALCYPDCPASLCIKDICAKAAPLRRPPPAQRGLWARVASLFL